MSEGYESAREQARDKRTQRLAVAMGERTVGRTLESLLRFQRRLSGEEIIGAVGAGFRSGFEQAIGDREIGLMNDEHSEAPGLTLLVNGRGINCLWDRAAAAADDDSSRAFWAARAESAQRVGEHDLYQIDLDNGWYHMSPDRCHVWGEATLPARDVRGVLTFEHPVEFSREHIVRIEGWQEGEWWQNPRFSSVGEPQP